MNRRTPLFLLGFLGFLALSALMVLLKDHVGWPLPPCQFKVLTGLPCPSCGGTRCMRALLRGDLLAAWHWHAPGFLLILAMAVLSVLDGVRALLNKPYPELPEGLLRLLLWVLLPLAWGVQIMRGV